MAFDDAEFGAGKAETERLLERMRRSAARLDAAEKAAEEEKRLDSRSGGTGRRSGGNKAAEEGPLTKEEATSYEAVNAKLDERLALEARILRNQEAMLANSKRQLNAYESNPAFLPAVQSRELTPFAGGGGRGEPPRLPPRFFSQYPELPPERRGGLPPGGPPYPGQKLLGAGPAAGAQPAEDYYKRQAEGARNFSNAGRGYIATESQMATASDHLGESIGHTAEFQRSANQTYTRFGALSSEWIGAAARGSTTIEELGRQTTATIGKFGGWLAAGGLVFGALDAVRAIGKGAIESASGVNQLERVIKTKSSIDPNSLQQSFRTYSQHFNLPIEDVTSAAYEMGKVFKTQSEALEASRAVLYSVKVGELDVATASRYLIAIINGFHLPANQLVGVFDQLNQAQNEFGISISDVEGGLAKASGSFNAATTKGSPLQKYHELLALITTAQKATGQTGQVVGTAIQRAPNFLRQEKNKEILKKYGIDAGGDLNDIIVQGFEKSQTLSGHKIAELASAIFGPQYGARIGTPLFQQFDLYKKVFAKTTAKESKGSGETELQTQLGALSEKITRIRTDLESLGSGLAEAGFFNLLGVGLETLTGMLGVVNSLLDVFNRLPSPIKDALSFLIEMKLVLGGLRKFNVGDSLFAGSSRTGLQTFFNPKNATKNKYGDLLRSEGDEARNELERANRQIIAAENRLPTAYGRESKAQERVDVLRGDPLHEQYDQSKGRVVKSDELIAQEKGLTAAQREVQALEAKQIQGAELRRAHLEQLKAVELENVDLQAATNAQQVEQLALQRGKIIPDTFNVGRGASADELAKSIGGKFDAQGNLIDEPLVVGGLQKGAAGAEASASEAVKAEAAATKIGAIRSKFSAGLSTAGEALGATGAAFKGLGSSMLGFAGGPLGLALLSLPFLIGPANELAKMLAGGQQDIENAEHLNEHLTGGSLKKYGKAYEEQERLIREQKRVGGETNDEVEEEAYFGTTPEDRLNAVPEGVPSWYTRQRFLQDKRLAEAQKKALREHGRAASLPSDQLERQKENLEELKPGTKQYEKALNDVRHNVRFGDVDNAKKKQLLDQIRQIEAKGLNTSADVSAFFSDYNSVADKLLQARVQSLSQLVEGGPSVVGRKGIHQFVTASLTQGIRDLVSNKPAVREKGLQSLSQIPQALAAYEQAEFKASLALATSQKERNAAYGKYIDGVRRNLNVLKREGGNQLDHLTGELHKTDATIEKLESEGRGKPLTKGEEKSKYAKEISPQQQQEIQNLENLKERRKRLERTTHVYQKNLAVAERELEVLIAEQAEARTQEHVSVFGELGQLASARIGGTHPVAQAQATLKYAQQSLQYVKSHKHEPQDLRQAELAVLNAKETIEQAIKTEASELASATEALSQAKANGDPILEAQAEIQKALSDLDLARNAAERKNAEAELINAEHKLDEARANIALARIGLASSEVESPIKKAALKIKEAEVKLRTAHGQAAKDEARAARNEAVREHREAVNSQAIENVEFDANIGKLTTDQQIAAYTRLLHTLKLGRNARRSLLEKIHALQEEASGSLELTVGNIALPTLYDIRRAVQGGITGGSVGPGSYQDASTNTYNYHIHGNQKEIEAALHNTHSRNTKNAKRSAGIGK